MKLGSQNWERWSCPYRFWQGRGKYWTWRPNYDFTLSKSEHEREVHATHMVWKWSELKWVSHTLTLEVMVCRKCSIMSSSILSRNAFTLTFWPVLTLQMYVSLCQTVLLKKINMESIDQIKSCYSQIKTLSTVTNTAVWVIEHAQVQSQLSDLHLCTH